jgi:hypothetical protein
MALEDDTRIVNVIKKMGFEGEEYIGPIPKP